VPTSPVVVSDPHPLVPAHSYTPRAFRRTYIDGMSIFATFLTVRCTHLCNGRAVLVARERMHLLSSTPLKKVKSAFLQIFLQIACLAAWGVALAKLLRMGPSAASAQPTHSRRGGYAGVIFVGVVWGTKVKGSADWMDRPRGGGGAAAPRGHARPETSAPPPTMQTFVCACCGIEVTFDYKGRLPPHEVSIVCVPLTPCSILCRTSTEVPRWRHGIGYLKGAPSQR